MHLFCRPLLKRSGDRSAGATVWSKAKLARMLAALLFLPHSAVAEEVPYFSSQDFADAMTETVWSRANVSSDRGTHPVCVPEVEEPSNVVILSSYSGGPELPGLGAFSPLSLAEVRVSATDEPVFLVLTGYEQIVWHFVPEPDAQISGVVLLGYYPQLILDLPPGVPVSSRRTVEKSVPQQLECIHTKELTPTQQRDWDRDSNSTINSTIQARRLFSILTAYGPLTLHDHQYIHTSDEHLVFEVTD